MSKSEIDKIKSVLAEINIATKGLENDFLIKTLTKALEIAVDELSEHAQGNSSSDDAINALKQISEILEDKI